MLSNKGTEICALELRYQVHLLKTTLILSLFISTKSLGRNLNTQQDLCYADCVDVTLLMLLFKAKEECGKRNCYVGWVAFCSLSNLKLVLHLNMIPLS